MRSIRPTQVFALALTFLVGFAVVQAAPSGNNCSGGDGGSSIDSMQAFSCMSSQNVSGSDGGTIAVDLTATPSTISQGQSSTLSWVSSGADACAIISAVEGQTGNPTSVMQNGPASGNISVSPMETTNYAVICNSNAGAIGGDQVVVTVNAGAPDLYISASTAAQASDSLDVAIWSRVMNGGNDSTN